VRSMAAWESAPGALWRASKTSTGENFNDIKTGMGWLGAN
jgi:hypothetical protein